MNTDMNVADIVVHLHPGPTAECKGRIDEGLRALDGFASVYFNEEEHPHALIVGV
jgi:hypothetical protein